MAELLGASLMQDSMEVCILRFLCSTSTDDERATQDISIRQDFNKTLGLYNWSSLVKHFHTKILLNKVVANNHFDMHNYESASKYFMKSRFVTSYLLFK